MRFGGGGRGWTSIHEILGRATEKRLWLEKNEENVYTSLHEFLISLGNAIKLDSSAPVALRRFFVRRVIERPGRSITLLTLSPRQKICSREVAKSQEEGHLEQIFCRRELST